LSATLVLPAPGDDEADACPFFSAELFLEKASTGVW
jgi:hypothetical protein